MKIDNWLFWILAHTVVFPLALLIGFIAVHLFSFIGQLFPEIIASGLGYILWGGIVGGLIGLTQWFFLKRYQISSGWIWKSAVGFALAETLMVIILLSMGVDRNIDLILSFGMEIWTLTYFVGGGITGFLQSTYLKKFSLQYRYWILANAFIWGISTLLWTILIKYRIGGNAIILLGGLGLGILSALVLNLLLKKTRIE
ncbi:MAG: hypothetical protein KJP14_04565 [Eudoraea sp.]|nr:hypothetical protein [Eudoraea sp.]MBT8222413.1 hypothetical protein [Eudoraea sp.]NNK70665.1 hypothetical protein [Flavobacteriaceae bacterium]